MREERVAVGMLRQPHQQLVRRNDALRDGLAAMDALEDGVHQLQDVLHLTEAPLAHRLL